METGHSMAEIDRMDICAYIRMLAWKSQQDPEAMDGFIDDVL